MTPYAQRHFEYRGLWTVDGFRVKIYGIHHAARGSPGEADFAIARPIVEKVLGAIDAGRHHGAAFVMLHFGATGDFLLIYWWTGEDILQRAIYVRQNGLPDYQDQSSGGLVACVWEMQVIDTERRAWINHVLKPGANAEGYWEAHFDGPF